MSNNQILDNALFRLATELTSASTTVDIYAINSSWTLTDDILATIIQKFKLKVVSKDSQSTFESMRIASVVANGTIYGLPRYTCTLALATDGANPTMRGLANSDDGRNVEANRIASRIVSSFPADSPCGIFVGNAEYQEWLDSFSAETTTYPATYGETIGALIPFMVNPTTKKIMIYDGTYPLKGITIAAGVLNDVKNVGTWGYLSTGHSAWDSTKKVYADSATGDWTQTPSGTTVLAGSPEIPSGGSDFTALRLALAADATEIASQAEAIAGTENTKQMTPLRTFQAIQTGKPLFAIDSVGTDSYAIAPTPAVTALVDGQEFRVRFGTANTGACTIAVGSVAAKSLKKYQGAAIAELATGDILAAQEGTIRYNSGLDIFVIISQLASTANATDIAGASIISASGSVTLHATINTNVTVTHNLGRVPKFIGISTGQVGTTYIVGGCSFVGAATQPTYYYQIGSSMASSGVNLVVSNVTANAFDIKLSSGPGSSIHNYIVIG